MNVGFSPAPGETRTIIIVWEVDDATKKDDRRYWWTQDDVDRMRKSLPDIPDLAGRPKGRSLADLQREADERGEVDLAHPAAPGGDTASVRLPLAEWSDADPERTRLIVMHQRRPAPGEPKRPPRAVWPDNVEAMRKEWRAAEAASETERAGELRERYDAETRKLGFRKATEISAWDLARAVEIRPGVFAHDERPPASAAPAISDVGRALVQHGSTLETQVRPLVRDEFVELPLHHRGGSGGARVRLALVPRLVRHLRQAPDRTARSARTQPPARRRPPRPHGR